MDLAHAPSDGLMRAAVDAITIPLGLFRKNWIICLNL